MTGMTKSEREDLQRLIRQREKTKKSAAKLRSTELLADFENQLASEFRFDDDTVWAEAAKAAQTEIDRAQKRIAARCEELGIPDRFAPDLQLLWSKTVGDAKFLAARRNALLRSIDFGLRCLRGFSPNGIVVEAELRCELVFEIRQQLG